jgi:hypothetical protein
MQDSTVKSAPADEPTSLGFENHKEQSARYAHLKVDLKKRFPLQLRAATRWSFPHLCLFVIAVIVAWGVNFFYLVPYEPSAAAREEVRNWLILAIGTSFGIWIYWRAWRLLQGEFICYWLTDGAFHMSRGPFLRQQTILRLSHITDVYTEPATLDFIFHLRPVYLLTPHSVSRDCVYVEPLSVNDGMAMRDLLCDAIHIYHHESRTEWYRFLERAANWPNTTAPQPRQSEPEKATSKSRIKDFAKKQIETNPVALPGRPTPFAA